MNRDRCPADDLLDAGRNAPTRPRRTVDGHLRTAGMTTPAELADAEALRRPRSRARADRGPASAPTCSPTSVDEADLIRQHSPLMSPLVWDLAHIGNQEELWLLREVGGREPDAPGHRPALRRVRAPARRAPHPAAAAARPRRARTSPRSAAGCSTCSRRRTCSTAAPLVDRRLRLRHDRPARAAARRDDARHPPAAPRAPPVLTRRRRRPRPADAVRLPAEVLVPGGPFTMGTCTEPWALDNERPAHTVDVPAFWIDTAPVTNGAYQQFIADGGYDDPRWWTPGGLGAPAAGRAGRAAVLAPRRRRLAAAALRRDRAGAAPTSRCCTCAGTRPTRTRAGPGGGCPPRPSGRRPPGTTRRPGAPAATRGATTTPRPRHANLGQRHLRPRAGRRYPAGAAPLRRAPADRRRLGVDLQRLPPYPGFAAFPYREYSEVFFGAEYKVLRGGSFGARPGRLPGHVPQLGPPDPAADLRRLPHRPGRRPATAGGGRPA